MTFFLYCNLIYACVVVFSRAVSLYPKHMAGYWAKVARLVGTRSAEECHNQYTSQGTSKTPAKKARKPKKKKIEAPKDPGRERPFFFRLRLCCLDIKLIKREH